MNLNVKSVSLVFINNISYSKNKKPFLLEFSTEEENFVIEILVFTLIKRNFSEYKGFFVKISTSTLVINNISYGHDNFHALVNLTLGTKMKDKINNVATD